MVELHLITVFNLQSLLKVGREYIFALFCNICHNGDFENYFKQIIADYYTRVKGNREASVDILLEN